MRSRASTQPAACFIYAITWRHGDLGGGPRFVVAALWGIAVSQMGGGADYHALAAANQPAVTDPDSISVGQVLRVPYRD